MRAFRLLVLRRLRQTPMRAATTILSIAAGVALAVSITILLASIDRSLSDFGRGLAGPAPLRITGATITGGLEEDVLVRAEHVDGVAAVVPMIQAISRTQPTAGGALSPVLVLGVDCQVEVLLGSVGCDPAAIAEATEVLAVGPKVETGPGGLLRTENGSLPLGGVPSLDALADIGDGRTVVLPLSLAQRELSRPGQIDVAYVTTEPGADVTAVRAALQAAVGEHLPVRAATDPPAGADAVLGAALPIYSLLGTFALGIGAVLVANTAAMSLETRRRELAVIGALGGRRSSVVGATIAEMAALGAVAGVLGTLGGLVVATPIVASFSTFTEEVAGAALATHVPVSALVTGVLLGALLGGGAAVVPARRATRLDVAAELSGRESADATRPPRLGRRAALWTAVAVLGLVGCWLAQRDSGLEPWQGALVVPAFLTVSLSLLFATAAVAPLLIGRLRALAGLTSSGTLRLALNAAQRDHRRSGLLAVTVGAAVVTAFVTEGSSQAARSSIEATIARSGQGVDVSTIPFDDVAAPNVSRELSFALGGVDGVARVHRGVDAVTDMASDPVLVLAMTGDPLVSTVIDGEATGEGLAAGQVLIGPGIARARGIRAGDQVELTTMDGPVRLPVQGVWEQGANVGMNVTMSPELLERLFGPQPAAFVTAAPADGVSEAELGRRIEAAGLHPEIRTRSSGALADAIADQVDEQFASFRVMQQALLAVLFAAVFSSLLLSAVQRRRELGLLAAVGADPPGIARLLIVEAGLVAIAGITLSFVVGPMMMFALNQVLPFVVGFRNPLVLEWGALATAGLIAMLVVLVAAAWPARRAAQVEVLEALRYE